MLTTDTQVRANKAGDKALAMFESAITNLDVANTLHLEVEREAQEQAALLISRANASRSAIEKNERIKAKITALVSDDE